MKQQAHSRNFYEIMIKHYEDELPTLEDGPKKTAITARLDDYRIELAEIDRPRSRNGVASRLAVGADAPGSARTWIEEWYSRAKPWLVVHKSGAQKNGRENLRVRLTVGADLVDLASETRLKIVGFAGDASHNDIIFPSPAARNRMIALIQAGA